MGKVITQAESRQVCRGLLNLTTKFDSLSYVHPRQEHSDVYVCRNS